MARRDLFEARLTRKPRQLRLGLGVLPGVQQRNRDGLESFVSSLAQHREHGLFVQCRERPPLEIDAPAHLLDGRVQRLGFADVEIEQSRASLGTDAQQIPKPSIRDQQRTRTCALEKSVGGDRRPHLHRGDGSCRDRRITRKAQSSPDACHRSIRVLLGVVAQQLDCREPTGGTQSNDVGKRAAAIDPKLPCHGAPLSSTAHHAGRSLRTVGSPNRSSIRYTTPSSCGVRITRPAAWITLRSPGMRKV